jgi:CHAT domain-containing protein/tetratricopeptide (TPR) repeat protein
MRLCILVLIAALLATGRPSICLAQDRADIDALREKIDLLQGQQKCAEAIPLAEQRLRLAERRLGKDHPETLSGIYSLAELYTCQGRYGEAEPLFLRALSGRERVLGWERLETLATASALATLYKEQGRYEQAERLFRRALETQERLFGKDASLTTLPTIGNLAVLYLDQGRYAEAEPLFRRLFEHYSFPDKDGRDALISAHNLAIVYSALGRHAEAERLYRRNLETAERTLGAEDLLMLATVNNLGDFYVEQGRYKQAEPLCRRALDLHQRALGKEHPNTLMALMNLGDLYSRMGRYPEAEQLYVRGFEARQRVLGADHPNTIGAANNLAELHFARRNWSRAAQLWQRSTDATAKRVLRSTQDATVTGSKKNDAERAHVQFKNLAKATYRLATDGSLPSAAQIDQTFQAAQWALSSEAAKSLVQMAARGAKGDGALAGLIRERQDLVVEWRRLDAQRNAWLGQAEEKRSKTVEDANLARMSAIDKRIAAIDKRLAGDFREYASLVSPAPLSIEETQAQLRADEALVLILDTDALKPEPEESFIWVVTKTDRRWVRSHLGTEALRREVQALRCGLDLEVRAEAQCASLASASAGGPIGFDLARAHGLYKALLGGVEDLIKDRHLLIVPSGALTQLPFQVLVKTPAGNDDYKSAAWLVRDHAVTVLPAVSSLEALRSVGHPGAAPKPMIGFGNPLLDGPQNTPQSAAFYKQLAQQARDNQRCRASSGPDLAWLGLNRGAKPMEMRDGLVQVSQIRTLAPLPETADELCAVARNLEAEIEDIRLGAAATEREVKRLSASGQLRQYRIVHFATHGALAGQVKGNSEPGLILTPPAKPTSDDDGYLSASEIAALKLDADWVILSACNTAAGDAANSEALSGLARAFIYAQARALLVSHWAVNSNATVKLITTAMIEMTASPAVGRAEALRRAMLALIDKGTAQEAHPSYWAPFIVVGEGAR